MDMPKDMALAKAEMPSRSNHKDGDDEIVVYKNWIRSSQRWNYVVEERWQVEVMIQQE
jgi:hypothetical protein